MEGKDGKMRRKEMGNEDMWEVRTSEMRINEKRDEKWWDNKKKGYGQWGYVRRKEMGKVGKIRRKEMGNEDIWKERKWEMRIYENKGDGKWGYVRRKEMGNEDIWEERIVGKWGYVRIKEIWNEDTWEERRWKIRTYETKKDWKWGYARRKKMEKWIYEKNGMGKVEMGSQEV